MCSKAHLSSTPVVGSLLIQLIKWGGGREDCWETSFKSPKEVWSPDSAAGTVPKVSPKRLNSESTLTQPEIQENVQGTPKRERVKERSEHQAISTQCSGKEKAPGPFPPTLPTW